MAASNTLIGWPIWSDDGVLATPTITGGSWVAGLPLANLRNPELYKVARSTSASPADTRFRIDTVFDRAVRVLGVVYRSPEITGAPTTGARFRFVAFPSSAQGVLFAYESGDDLTALGATFTRTGTANYVDSSGVLRSAATGVARDSHFIGGVRHTLVEAASTNLVLQSENFGTTWSAFGTPTRSAAAHTASGVTLDLIGDNDAAGVEGYLQNVTFTGNAAKAVSVFVKRDTATSSVILLRDTTAGANRLLAVVTWSGTVPSVATTTGTYIGAEAMAGGVYRLLFTTTSVTAANNNQLSVYAASDSALSAGGTGTIYAGGVQAENATVPSSYIKTTTGTVTRNADSLSFATVSSNGTIYQKYWDLATLAYVESTLAYTSGAAIPFTSGRGYVSTRIATGTKTQAEMQAIVYDSGWLTPFPPGGNRETVEGQNLAAWVIFTANTTLEYVNVQVDDPTNAAGFVDLNRVIVAAGIQPASNTIVGAKLGLETGTVNTDGDSSVTSSLRKPTRRNATVGWDEQSDADAFTQFIMQRVAGTSRQMVFVWDPTDATYLQHRTFLATLSKLSEFEANIGNRWVIPYAFREVL